MHGKVRTLDVGKITALSMEMDQNGQRSPCTTHFINIAGFGYSSHAVYALSKSYLVKVLAGGFVYWLYGLLTKLFYYSALNVVCTVKGWLPMPPPSENPHALENGMDEATQDGEEKSHDKEMLVPRVEMGAICNARYFGGNMLIAPHADPTDGLLDVLMTNDISLIRAVRHVMPGVKDGTLLQRLGPEHCQTFRCTDLHVALAQEDGCKKRIMYVDADGECAGVGPAQFSIIKQALNVVLPQDIQFD